MPCRRHARHSGPAFGRPEHKLYAGHPRLNLTCRFKDVDGRDIGVRKHAVLRTAIPSHDESKRTASHPSCPRSSRASTFHGLASVKTWTAGTSPAMTSPGPRVRGDERIAYDPLPRRRRSHKNKNSARVIHSHDQHCRQTPNNFFSHSHAQQNAAKIAARARLNIRSKEARQAHFTAKYFLLRHPGHSKFARAV